MWWGLCLGVDISFEIRYNGRAVKKRLRKKLGKGEFTEIVFCMVFGIKGSDYSDEQTAKLFDIIRDECLLPNNLGGALFPSADQKYGLLVSCGLTRKVSPEQRQIVLDWMNAREDVEHLQVGELVDINLLFTSFLSKET